MFVAQLCQLLYDPVDCSLPGSSVHGISQARILEFPFPFPGDLSDLGIKPESRALQTDSLLSEPPGKLCSEASDYSYDGQSGMSV